MKNDFDNLSNLVYSSPEIDNLLRSRYFLKNEKSWDDVAKRVSAILEGFYPYVRDQYFCPSTPTLFNLNTKGERKGTLSSCFTMGIDDSIEGIFESAKECAVVTKAAGGVGYVFDLRADTEKIKSINRASSGPLPFVKVFNSILDGMTQGGARKGAGMAQFSITHPNILKIISAKRAGHKDFDRFNISIRVPDWFYEKLEKSPEDIMQVKNITDEQTFDLEENGVKISIKELWRRIVTFAWESAEPGIFNETIAYNRSTVTNLDPIIFSNPCAEFVSIKYSSCNLGSINLVKFVKDGAFDFQKFEEVVEQATLYLNQIIDNNVFPLEKIKQTTKKTRPIGLGFMGLAHAYYLLKIPFQSAEAKALLEKISYILTIKSMEVSVELSKKDGPYEAFDLDLFLKVNDRFWQTERGLKLKENISKYGIRNHATTSIAPTGSISFLYNISSGLEPVFGLSYIRKIETGDRVYREVVVADRFFDQYLQDNYPDKKEEILKDVALNNGSCQKNTILTEAEKKIFITARDLTPMEHLESLAIVCNNVNFSCSKTINLPKDCSPDDIDVVYRAAHKLGVMGVAVYRDGSREGILVDTNAQKRESIVKTIAPKRPQILDGELHHFILEGRRYYVAIGLFDGKDPYEIFTGINETKKEIFIPRSVKKGKIEKQRRGKYVFLCEGEESYELTNGHSDCTASALSRVISASLRHGCDLKFLVEQLLKTEGPMTCFTKFLARTLKKYIKDGDHSTENCPECKNKMIFLEGCQNCPSCGYSKCG